MSTIHMHQTTTSPPEQFLDALTDWTRPFEALWQQRRRVFEGA